MALNSVLWSSSNRRSPAQILCSLRLPYIRTWSTDVRNISSQKKKKISLLRGIVYQKVFMQIFPLWSVHSFDVLCPTLCLIFAETSKTDDLVCDKYAVFTLRVKTVFHVSSQWAVSLTSSSRQLIAYCEILHSQSHDNFSRSQHGTLF